MTTSSFSRFDRPIRAVWMFVCGSPLRVSILGIALAGSMVGQDGSGIKKVPQAKTDVPSFPSPPPGRQDNAISAARERAKLLHDVYSTTLDVMHHRYFRHDTAVVPARALEEVFEEMAGHSGGVANWISVNTKAMSINHEPTTTFEKKAAAELASGKPEYEQIAKRVYRRAAPIALRSSCVSCHTNMFSDHSTSPRIAGLVISIPLSAEEK